MQTVLNFSQYRELAPLPPLLGVVILITLAIAVSGWFAVADLKWAEKWSELTLRPATFFVGMPVGTPKGVVAL